MNANPMTVADIVAQLLTMPQDAVALYRCCSDYTPLEAGEIKLVTAEEQRVVYRPQNGFSEFVARWYPPNGEKPDFRTAVLFPGN